MSTPVVKGLEWKLTKRNRILLGQSKDRLSEVIQDLRRQEQQDPSKNHGQLLTQLGVCMEHLEATLKP